MAGGHGSAARGMETLQAVEAREPYHAAVSYTHLDETKLERWVEGVAPIAVRGDPSRIVSTDTHNISMASHVGEYIDKYVALTKELMGACLLYTSRCV